MGVFWVVTTCDLVLLRNVGNHLQDHMASQLRRSSSRFIITFILHFKLFLYIFFNNCSLNVDANTFAYFVCCNANCFCLCFLRLKCNVLTLRAFT
jgi:hypothetical protein